MAIRGEHQLPGWSFQKPGPVFPILGELPCDTRFGHAIDFPGDSGIPKLADRVIVGAFSLVSGQVFQGYR
ncbi:hypothetical protein D3C84_1200760 [compost metagenome]